MFRKWLYSFWYAGKGLMYLIRHERQFQVHIGIALGVVCAGFYFEILPTEWIAVVLSIAIVMTAEALNTALEQLVNWISPERHAEAGKVKDIAAGAVLLSALGAFVVGLIVFLPKISKFFRHLS